MRPPKRARRPGQPRPRLLPTKPPQRLGGNRACLALARKLLKRSYHTPRSLGDQALAARLTFPSRAKPHVTPMHRGQLPASSLPPLRVDGPERLSGRTASPSGNTPSHIMSPTRSQPGSRTEVSLGARGHTPTPQRAHAPTRQPQRSTRR